MFALDLFNNDHERRIAEGAVDNLEARRIDDLAMKMDDLVARAFTPTTTPKVKSALMKEFQKCKAERDSYFKIKDECMGYGTLGETDQVPVGRMQPGTPEYAAARNRSVKYAGSTPDYSGGHKTAGPATVGYKKATNKPLVPDEVEVAEAGIPGNVPADKIPGKEDLLKGRGRTYYEESQLNEYIVRSGDDVMSVLALNLFADLLGKGNLSDYDEEFANSPEWQAVVANWAPKAEYLQQQLAKYQNVGRKLRDAEADAIDATAYDGSDAYENADIAASYLPKVYAKQAAAIVRLLKDGYANPDSTMHEAEANNALRAEVEVAEAGLPDVANKEAKMARLNQSNKVGTDVVTPQQRVNPNPNKGVVGHAADWLRGKGGPGKEGPTFESEPGQKKKLDPDLDSSTARDATVQRELQKLRAKHPNARSDIEALVKDEIVQQDKDNKAFSSIRNVNSKQDDLLNQIIALDKQQGDEINHLDHENTSLEKELKDVEAVNNKLAQTLSSMTGTKQSSRPKSSDNSDKSDKKLSGTSTTYSSPAASAAPASPLSPSPVDNTKTPDNKNQSGARSFANIAATATRDQATNQEKNPSQPDLFNPTNKDRQQELPLSGGGNVIDLFPNADTKTAQANRNYSGSNSAALDQPLSGTRGTGAAGAAVLHPNFGNNAFKALAKHHSADDLVSQPDDPYKTGTHSKNESQLNEFGDVVQMPGTQANAAELPGQQQATKIAISIVSLILRGDPTNQSPQLRNDLQRLGYRLRFDRPGIRLINDKYNKQVPIPINLFPRDVQQALAAPPAAVDENIEPGEEMTTNELLYRAAVEYMQRMGQEGRPVEYETAVKLAAKHYHIPYRPGMVPELYNKRAELDAKLDAAIRTRQAERGARKQKQLARTAPTTPEQEKKMQDYWSKNAPHATRVKAPAKSLEEDQRLHVGDPIVVTAPNEFEGKTGEIYDFSPSGTFVIVDLYNHGKHSMHLSDVEYNQYADDQDDLDESAMSELDAMRQDLELMNDRQFYTAYGISKQAFQQKYRTLLHPAQQQDTPVKEGTQSEEWTVSIDGKPWKSYPGYAQATKAAQTIEKKYGKKTSVTSTVIQTSQAYNDGQADKWHHRQPRNDFEKGTKDYQDYVDGYSGRPFTKQGVAEGQQPMTRNAVIQKLEAIYTKLYKDEDPESYDLPAAVDYWHGLSPDELAMEFEDAIDRLKQSRSNVAEVKADPTGSWVVYDGSKVKRFKTHGGAKAYAEKAGGKVASSEFYQDKIQNKQVNEDEDHGPYMWFKDNIRDPGRPLNMTKDKAIQFVKGREIMQQQVANWGAVVDNAGKVVFRYDPRGRLPERFHGEHDLRDAPADVIHWDAIEPGSPEMTRALGPDRGSNRSDYFNKDTAQDWNDWADEKEKPKHKETDEGLDSYRHMKPNMIKPQNNKIDVANQKFPDPRKPYIENGKVTGIMGPDGKKYMMSKSDTVGADGMIYHWQDPRARSKTGQQGVAEDADQVKKVFKDKSGKPVGEIGIDPESSPGNGEWYVYHYATGYSVVGFDSAAEAKRELVYVHKHPDAVEGHPSTKEQGVSEEFENGSKVQHPKYGAGQVYKVYPNGMISVNFPEYLAPMSQKPGVTGNFNPGDSDYQSLKEAQTDYQKRRQRERDVDAGRPVKPLPKNPQTDYAKKRAKDRKDMELGEDSGNSSEAAERAILHRIMVAHTDLLKQFGPQKVMQAAEEVAYNVGDLDEIGTSDVSAWVNEVRQILGA